MVQEEEEIKRESLVGQPLLRAVTFLYNFPMCLCPTPAFFHQISCLHLKSGIFAEKHELLTILEKCRKHCSVFYVEGNIDP